MTNVRIKSYVNESKFHHVWIIPVSRPSILDNLVLVVSIEVYDAGHRLPTVLDIIKVSPDVAGVDDGCVVWLKKNHNFLKFSNTVRIQIVVNKSLPLIEFL